MSRGNRSGFRNKTHKPKLTEVEENHPILKAFYKYRTELDDKHDRYERIVKLGRDITIESKRIIFLLHTIDCRQNNKESILKQADQRLQTLIDTNFKAITKEIGCLDPYQYKGAFSAGLQEFIEAYTFMRYMNGYETPLPDWNEIQDKITFVGEVNDAGEYNAPLEHHEADENIASEPQVRLEKLVFIVDPTEYILGLSDLTGELMRRCINCLGSGETKTCMEICKSLQHLYMGYISLTTQRCRELSRKIYTMYQSVLKAENVCYNVKVRGGEAAKWGAVTAFDCKPSLEIDEGFY